MKKILVAVLTLISCANVLAQSDTSKTIVNGMVTVPAGEFMFNTTKTKVNTFLLSNEITNGQYREFVDYAVKHPFDSLFLCSTTASDSVKKLNFVVYGVIVKGLLDTLALGHVYKGDIEKFKYYKEYVTNGKFNNFPVLGVTQRSARYYCFWRTFMFSQAQKEKKTKTICEFRLPELMEWEYVANLVGDSEGKGKDEVQEVQAAKVNKLGLTHLYGNVSEWTATSSAANKPNIKIAKGGSWKTPEPKDFKLSLGEDLKASHIGFRVVANYYEGK